jgi:DNA repair protein RadC
VRKDCAVTTGAAEVLPLVLWLMDIKAVRSINCAHFKKQREVMSLHDWPEATRPREKLLSLGPAALSDVELLALLLRTGTSGKNVLQLAAEILQPSALRPQGGFAALLHSTPQDLAPIKGLGPAKRAEILAVLEIARRALQQDLQARPVLESAAHVRQLLQLHLGGKNHEVFAVLFLDSQNKLIAFEELFRGSLNQTRIYPREVVLRALHHHANALILAHNHPSGDAVASHADIQITRQLAAALGLVDVRVLDHIIVGPGQALSMAETGLI